MTLLNTILSKMFFYCNLVETNLRFSGWRRYVALSFGSICLFILTDIQDGRRSENFEQFDSYYRKALWDISDLLDSTDALLLKIKILIKFRTKFRSKNENQQRDTLGCLFDIY